MSFKSKLMAAPNEFPFSITGTFNFPDDNNGEVIIKLDDDADLKVNESDINSDLIFPLSDLEFSKGSGYIVKLKKDASVTLRFKTVSHTFKLNLETERQFYIDTEELVVRYIDELPQDTTSRFAAGDCKKWVLVVDAKCCRNDRYVSKDYGFVSCNQNWNDSRCCP